MSRHQMLIDVLSKPAAAMVVACQQALELAHPDAFIQPVEDSSFDPQFWNRPWELWPSEEFSDAGLLKVTYSEEDGLQNDLVGGRYEIRWDGQVTQLYYIKVPDNFRSDMVWFVIGKDETSTKNWIERVCKICSDPTGVIQVFHNGMWCASPELFNSIQSTNLEDLVLEGSLKEELLADINQFLSQEETYKELNLAWKRGLLLLGPPGNGKTHLIRGLAKTLGLPTLYVKSFESQHWPPQSVVENAFSVARRKAPCLFVLEDLDTLIEGRTRSYFLNELDGFASNHGILTIATCNFPERLDASILDRPSRFDRKYHFNLPGFEGRLHYLTLARGRYGDKLPLDDETLVTIAGESEGYSYAYLKELVLSSVVSWVSANRQEPLAQVMKRQVATLLEQMRTERTPPSVHVSERNVNLFD